MTSPYSPEFYSSHASGSYASAMRILPPILKALNPDSIADFGCGAHGAWLRAAKALGVKSAEGFDGVWAKPVPSEDQYKFTTYDFESGAPSVTRVNIAMSLEVVEHLTPSAAEKLVNLMCSSSDVLLFAAALPGQGGTGHINERPLSYWVELFGQRNYVCLDVVRPSIWNDKNVEPWYRQNIVIFMKKDIPSFAESKLALEEQLKAVTIFDYVHPDLFTMRIKQCEDELKPYWNPTFRNCLGMIRRWIKG